MRVLKSLARSALTRKGWSSWAPPSHDPLAPPYPPDWRVGPPDYVGVGVQRAGTTWWDGLIRDHPQVSTLAERPKEVHFFDDYWRKPFTQGDAERYHAFFPRPDGGFAGEWTPRYMSDFWVPALLRRAAPATKLLVMLRDPIERYASGIAFNLGRRRAPLNPIVPEEAMARGLYFQQLEWLLEHFDRSQLLLLQFERCVRDPQGELRRTYRFLGLTSDFVPPGLHEPRNETTWGSKAVPAATRRELETVYRPELARLGQAFPEIDLALWPTYTGEQARLSSRPDAA
jgi:hypothetical protein